MIAFWFRRDLRLEDNIGLGAALQTAKPVLPVFIFDTNILDLLFNRTDARVQFIYNQLLSLKQKLKSYGSDLFVGVGTPEQVWSELIKHFPITAVYTNEDYEPYAVQRDSTIQKLLLSHNITFHAYKDQVIFAKSDVVKEDGKPYTVFTPYKKRWLKQFRSEMLAPKQMYFQQFYQTDSFSFPTLTQLGFSPVSVSFPSINLSETLLRNYQQQRDYPAIQGTSRLSVHLRFGTISIREVFRKTAGLSEMFWNELIWREFYMMILWHFPNVTQAFKPEYDLIPWRTSESDFERWKQGMTGYPLVDAGMRELAETGYMHNRIRMVTASFLTKHLLLDWRWGEAWFAEKLLDFDLAANNGGWQWAASSGCDAAPYFRIFNPTEQQKRFDPDFVYIKRWIPEWGTSRYPQPMIEHSFARKRAIVTYSQTLKSLPKNVPSLFD
ncbi:MAG: DNA photolyase family protein [Bacteroidia bacterium]|nr:DNA photolyase family protein [Bacteroidia bacterium]